MAGQVRWRVQITEEPPARSAMAQPSRAGEEGDAGSSFPLLASSPARLRWTLAAPLCLLPRPHTRLHFPLAMGLAGSSASIPAAASPGAADGSIGRGVVLGG